MCVCVCVFVCVHTHVLAGEADYMSEGLEAHMVKNPPSNVRDRGLIPGSGRSPGGGHGNPPQYSCLENPKDRGGWWSTVHRVTKSLTQLK